MKKPRINYAVVGLGHIAQVAVLPAFKVSRNSNLHSLVSGDGEKLRVLSKRYSVEAAYSYKEFDQCLNDDSVEAVYIALPNHLHLDCAIRCAEAGKHILCEKPLATTARDAQKIVSAARKNDVRLMTAYRLHLDPANLKAIEIVHSGKIGDIRFITSEFGHRIKNDNIRAEAIEGGSPLHDLGVYCINAARYLMKDEPIEVFATASAPTSRLPEIHPTVSAVLKFPKNRLASFTCSFDSAGVSNFRVVGSKGDLFLESPYEYVGEVTHQLTIDEKKKVWTSKIGDQFAAELDYFSDCVLENKEPGPSGREGVIDLQIIDALMESISSGHAIALDNFDSVRRPSVRQQIKKKPHRKPKLVNVESEAS